MKINYKPKKISSIRLIKQENICYSKPPVPQFKTEPKLKEYDKTEDASSKNHFFQKSVTYIENTNSIKKVTLITKNRSRNASVGAVTPNVSPKNPVDLKPS